MPLYSFSDECGSGDCVNPTEDTSDAFARVRATPSIAFGTTVEWILNPMFTDPEPHMATLQWGQTDSGEATDWEDIGLPVENVFSLEDSEQRAWGHIQRTNYRIKLETPLGIHYSLPVHCLGGLRPREWRLYSNRIRLWKKQFKHTIRGQGGYLLKRKVHGVSPEPEDKIMDWQTDEIIDAQNELTFGTEWIGGYYPAVCCDADLDNFVKFEHIAQNRGTVNDGSRISGAFLSVPMLDSGDIWVSRTSDFRWRIWAVQHIEELNGVPIALKCEMRLLPYSHIAYRIPVPGRS